MVSSLVGRLVGSMVRSTVSSDRVFIWRSGGTLPLRAPLTMAMLTTTIHLACDALYLQVEHDLLRALLAAVEHPRPFLDRAACLLPLPACLRLEGAQVGDRYSEGRQLVSRAARLLRHTIPRCAGSLTT